MDKSEILNRIKEIASQNGGTAPGMKKFHTFTGINNSAWYGKYWTKWSSALTEAGLQPNPPSLPYDRNLLIQKIISFIRDLKNFPTEPELRMKHYNDKTFPPAKRIRSHFGTKGELIRAVLDFCCALGNSDDVITICRKAYRRAAPAEELFYPRPYSNEGYICLVKFKDNYKLGSRPSELTEHDLAGHPKGLKIIHSYYSASEQFDLNNWYHKFQALHIDNNWYRLTPNEVREFSNKRSR